MRTLTLATFFQNLVLILVATAIGLGLRVFLPDDEGHHDELITRDGLYRDLYAHH